MKHKESSSSTNWLKAIARGWRACKNGYKSLYRGKPWYIKVLVALATIIVSFFLYLVAVDINFLWLFGKSPSTDQVMHPKTNQASYIYSADGKELGKYFDENRTIVAYDSINPEFFKVLIDTEDERFYSHHGIDYGGLIAAVKDMILHGKPRGASTITQQLVKNMFRTRTYYSTGLLGYIPGVKMLIMKSKEWILATKIEMFYDKSEILEMYANTVDFGSNAYGIKTAARTYFGTTPQKLKLQESAVLVGLLKATSTYNPRLNPKNSLQRRNVVLDNMRVRGDLTQAQYDSVSALPIELNFSIESAYDGEALYFREAVKNELDDWCRATNHDLFRDGLKIYTTIDTRMQKHAEQAVSNQMRKIQENFNRHWGNDECWIDENGDVIPNFVEEKARTTEVYRGLLARFPNDLDSVNYYMNLPHQVHLFDYENDSLYMEMSSMDSIRYMLHFMHTGFIAMEPQTGHVKAWVGDVDFDTWKYDKVSTKHQPGSTFKLFVYSAAMERGMVPCDRRRDQYFDTLVFNERTREMEHWHPTNANGHFSYSDMTLRSAFAQSARGHRCGHPRGCPDGPRHGHHLAARGDACAVAWRQRCESAGVGQRLRHRGCRRTIPRACAGDAHRRPGRQRGVSRAHRHPSGAELPLGLLHAANAAGRRKRCWRHEPVAQQLCVGVALRRGLRRKDRHEQPPCRRLVCGRDAKTGVWRLGGR